MVLQVKPSSDLLTEETAAYHRLVEAVYPRVLLETMPEANIQWMSPELRVMIWDEGKLVCHVGIVSREANVNGQLLRIGGIGGVMTHPDARHRGHATAGMKRAAALLGSEMGASFGLLVCRPDVRGVYAQLGWRVFSGRLLIQQHGQTVAYALGAPMLLPLLQLPPDSGEIDLLGLPW